MAVSVYLRKPTFAELSYIKHLWACPKTNKYIGGPYYMQDEAEWYHRWVEPGTPSRRYFLIFNREDDPVGEICFHSFDESTGSACMGMKVEAPFQGRGYATEAIQWLLDCFFTELHGEVMVDDLSLENLSGQRALLKFGFEHDPSVQDVFLVKISRERFLRKCS